MKILLVLIPVLILTSCVRESPLSPEIEPEQKLQDGSDSPEAVYPAELRGNTVEILVDSVFVIDTIIVRDLDTIFLEQLIERVDTIYLDKRAVRALDTESLEKDFQELEEYVKELEYALQSQDKRENTEETCIDGIDNDGDGFTDCQDVSCHDLVICNPK
jgi:hypothetical protein